MTVARPAPWRGWFSVGPYEDLGSRLDVAMKALGWREGDPVRPAFGWLWMRDRDYVRSQPSDSIDVVRGMGAAAVAETGEPVGIAEAFCMVGDRVLYRAMETLEPVASNYAEAHKAADDILWSVYKARRILDPSKPGSRAILIRQTADAMIAIAGRNERLQLRAAEQFIDQNWPELSAARRNELIEDAARRIRVVPLRSVRGIRGTIKVQGERTMRGARRAAIERHKFNISPNLTSPDRASIRAAQRTSVAWLNNEYGVRAVAFESSARSIVERGLVEGLGRQEIARDLSAALGSSMSGRTESYFRVFAASLVDRSRSRAELFSYREAGITKFVASAVVDGVTTDFCRWIDGKVLDVEKSINLMDAAEGEGLSVAQMKNANPWARRELDDDGNEFWGVRGQRMFKVQSSGLGTESSGRYTDQPASRNLEAAGIGPPPYHGNCRTTTVAEV